MRPRTAIGRYLTDEPLGPDTWSIEDLPSVEAHRLGGAPAADFAERAARLTALRHPHLSPIFAAALIDHRPWIVRPRLDGGTLADRLAAGHRPPYKVAIDVGVDVLRGLAAAHEAGFAHGALDASCVTWSDGVQIVGVGYRGLGGEGAEPADDVRAVTRLLGELVPDPPGELRALLAAPMPTAEAFCRALKTLDPALGQDRDFDFSRPTPAPGHRPPDPPAAAERAPQWTPPPAAPAAPTEDSWGVEAPASDAPPARGAGWVVGARDLVEASTDAEDTWGVGASPAAAPPREAPARGLRRDHTGAVVHTVSTAARAEPEAARSPLITVAVAVAVIAVVLVGARVVMNQLGAADEVPEPSVRPGLVAIDGGPVDAGIVASPTDAARAAAADAGEARVTLLIGPVPGRVVRVDDKAVVCDAARSCAVPIDIDYRVEAKGHVAQSISGDDLYDRRRIGQLEIVLQPVPPKEPRKKRRARPQ